MLTHLFALLPAACSPGGGTDLLGEGEELRVGLGGAVLLSLSML